jgi:hypothetical protein
MKYATLLCLLLATCDGQYAIRGSVSYVGKHGDYSMYRDANGYGYDVKFRNMNPEGYAK